MNKAGPPPFRQEDIAITKRLLPETRKKHEVYVAKGNWRCAGRPQAEGETLESYQAIKAASSEPHFSVGDNCIHCKEFRGKR